MTAAQNLGRFTIRHGATEHNSARRARPPRVAKTTIRTIEATDVDAIRTLLGARDAKPATNPYLRDFADLLVATGMRPSELLALAWDDVDIEARTLTVRATLVIDVHSKVVRQEHLKTASGFRTLHVPDFAVDVLMRRRLVSSSPWVFASRAGTLISPTNMRRAWRESSRAHRRQTRPRRCTARPSRRRSSERAARRPPRGSSATPATASPSTTTSRRCRKAQTPATCSPVCAVRALLSQRLLVVPVTGDARRDSRADHL